MFGVLKQILPHLRNFCRFAYMYKKSLDGNSLLGVRPNSTPQNYKQLVTGPQYIGT
jgi:hypothetical protein